MVLFIFVALSISLYLVNSFYPFFDLYGLMSSSAPSFKTERYWRNLNIPANTDPPNALYISKEESVTKRPAKYTVMMDLYIHSSKGPLLGTYRHVLHRGSDDSNQLATSSAATGRIGAINNPSSFEATAASAARSGGAPLPNFMNPGIFLHPFRNDLVFFIQTEAASKKVVGHDILYLESLALDDVPIQEWFRVTLTLSGNVVDVYKNGELMRSMILKGTPRNVSNEWFGRTGTSPFYGIIMNCQLWNGPLDPGQVKKAASGPFPPKPVLRGSVDSCEL
jgi:hypothetical protein